MPKIITAHTGEKHITSADAAAFNRGLVGYDDYVLCDAQGDFTATQTDMQQIQLSKAEAVVQGHHIRILDTDTVTIDDGQSGVSRIDLITLAYTKSSDGVESAEIKVIKGEPAVSPTAPSVTQSDLEGGGLYHEAALFQVTVSGVSTITVVRVCTCVNSLATLDGGYSGLGSMKNSIAANTSGVSKNTSDITALKKRDILWSGAYIGSDSSKITLADKISNYPSGATLVFSAYNGTEAKDYDFHLFFIPKEYISEKSGYGVRFNMVHNNFDTFASKYFYIHDSYITAPAKGSNYNLSSGTKNGIAFNNSQFVLRYVIGG